MIENLYAKFPSRPSTKSFFRMRLCLPLLLLVSCLNVVLVRVFVFVCVYVWCWKGGGCLKKLFKSRFRDYNDKTDLNCFQVALKLKILNIWN